MNLKLFFGIFTLIIAVFYGCELMDNRGPASKPVYGKDLIINEVFALPPDKFYAYSWIEVFNPTNQTISLADENYPISCWAVGSNGTMLTTTNSGDSWNVTTSNVVPKFNSITYYNTDTAFAAGDHGKLYRSGDSGKTWIDLHTDSLTKANLNCVYMLSAFQLNSNSQIWACGDSGTFLRTIDRGRTWKKLNTKRKGRLLNLGASTTNNLYAVGDSMILHTTSLGQNWDTLLLPSREIYTSIAVPGLNEARAVGTNGAIMYTSTRGSVWLAETTSVHTRLNSIAYLEGSGWEKAWAVGDDGTILTADGVGPSNWKTRVSGTTKNLHYVNFSDSSNGLAFGDAGTILNTTNGGRTWNLQTSGTTENLYGGAFLPLLVLVDNTYMLAAYSQRKYIFMHQDTASTQITAANPDYITNVDTGYTLIQPLNQGTINPGGFIVFVSDSGKFNDHTSVGPSHAKVQNSDLAYVVYRLARTVSGELPLLAIVKWDLLRSSEVRLLKIYEKLDITKRPPTVMGYDLRTIDVVRFGNFDMSKVRIDPKEVLAVQYINSAYPNDKSAPYIPEWWSLARYQDLVNTDLNTFSTDKYFYLCNKPLPGWVSQLRSH